MMISIHTSLETILSSPNQKARISADYPHDFELKVATQFEDYMSGSGLNDLISQKATDSPLDFVARVPAGSENANIKTKKVVNSMMFQPEQTIDSDLPQNRENTSTSNQAMLESMNRDVHHALSPKISTLTNKHAHNVLKILPLQIAERHGDGASIKAGMPAALPISNRDALLEITPSFKQLENHEIRKIESSGLQSHKTENDSVPASVQVVQRPKQSLPFINPLSVGVATQKEGDTVKYNHVMSTNTTADYSKIEGSQQEQTLLRQNSLIQVQTNDSHRAHENDFMADGKPTFDAANFARDAKQGPPSHAAKDAAVGISSGLHSFGSINPEPDEAMMGIDELLLSAPAKTANDQPAKAQLEFDRPRAHAIATTSYAQALQTDQITRVVKNGYHLDIVSSGRSLDVTITLESEAGLQSVATQRSALFDDVRRLGFDSIDLTVLLNDGSHRQTYSSSSVHETPSLEDIPATPDQVLVRVNKIISGILLDMRL